MIEIAHLQVAGKLSDVTLTVAPSEVLVLVGSRGSGKSTLLRTLTGLQAPSGGSATVAGLPAGDPAGRAKVGVVGESWGFMERLTVWESLITHAGFYGLPERRVLELVKRLDLLTQMRTRVGRLQAGELARLRLARALLHDPPVLLLDEPAGDIDGESATMIAFTIAEEAEAGKAVLVATFGYPRTLEIATRVCYLEGGRLIEPGPALVAATAPSPAPAAPLEAPAPRTPGGARVPHIAARKGERLLLFRPEEIRYAYAQEKAVYIKTSEGECDITFTLSDLEERLSDHGFFRCHRGYLVNISYVKEIATWTRDSFSLILKDGTDVPLSKHRANELRVRLHW